MADNSVGSPSASSKAESNEAKLATYKQKLKILKKAFLEEQEEKETFRKQLLSSYNTIDKLQKDLEEKEQKYLRTYKENQELHANLIEERSSSGRGHRGSVISMSNAFPDLGGYKEKSYDDYSPKKNNNGSAADTEVLNLKVQQMEKQIKHLEDERENVEQELYSK